MRYVILPQAARIAIAPTVGFSVQVIKGTALASIIGFVDLTKAGTMLNNATFRPFLVYSLVALIYFALCFPLSWYAHRLERQLQCRSLTSSMCERASADRSAEGRLGRRRARRRGRDHRPLGSGKSTLLRCVNGLETYDAGAIVVDGIDVGPSAGRSCAICAAMSAWCFSNSICSRISPRPRT